MPANDATGSPLTFGDLLAALMLISEKVPPRSLVSQLQNVNCSIGDTVQRSALITNAFHIKVTHECIELVYAVSPPGPRDAKMSKMKLQFSFAGKGDGKLNVWLNRPQEVRPEGFYKFGLGMSAMQQSSGVRNNFCFSPFRKEREALTCGNELIELELDGENLMGGVLHVIILATYPTHGVLSVRLWASTDIEDPKPEETDEFVESAMRRWNSRGFQKDLFGGRTMETYLEH